MALKSNFNEGQSRQDINRQKDNLYQRVINSFIRAGEDFVKEARNQSAGHEQGHYDDQTANLRNSIGYFIAIDGKIINSNPSDERTGKKSEGKLNAAEIAIINQGAINDIVKPEGIQLIGIAGMDYASHVESKGYNVISYQADVCMVDLAMYLEKLGVIEQNSAANIEESFIP